MDRRSRTGGRHHGCGRGDTTPGPRPSALGQVGLGAGRARRGLRTADQHATRSRPPAVPHRRWWRGPTMAYGPRWWRTTRPGLLTKLGALAGADRAGRRPAAPRRGERRGSRSCSRAGSQYACMGRQLHEQEPVFRRALDECVSLAAAHGIDLDTALRSADESALRQTRHTQPTIFTLQVSLLALLRSWGSPFRRDGHSMGEFAAAYAAGAVSLETAMRIICRRALLMEAMPPGAMLAAEMSRERFARYEGLRRSHSPQTTAPAASSCRARTMPFSNWHDALRQDGVRCRRLDVSHAFHHRSMDGALDGALDVAPGRRLREPQVPMVSTVHGDCSATPPADTALLLDNLGSRPVPRGHGDAQRSAAGHPPGGRPQFGAAQQRCGRHRRSAGGDVARHGDEGASLRQMLAPSTSRRRHRLEGYYRGHMPHAAGSRPDVPVRTHVALGPVPPEPEPGHVRSSLSGTAGRLGIEARTSGLLSVADHLILDAHRLHGTPVLPAPCSMPCAGCPARAART